MRLFTDHPKSLYYHLYDTNPDPTLTLILALTLNLTQSLVRYAENIDSDGAKGQAEHEESPHLSL